MNPTEPKSVRPQGAYLLVYDQQLLCREEGGLYLCSESELTAVQSVMGSKPQLLGYVRGRPHFLVSLSQPQSFAHAQWQGLRSQLGELDDQLFALAGQALQLSRWRSEHRFCGRCGGPTQDVPGERATLCTQCDLRFYPRLSPCMITLVTRGDHCLLARHARSKNPIFTALAGFVEVGERVEDTVHREVKEEVGLEVEGLRYFGSQPWPFPGQLMLGFHARYAAGAIRVDQTEIVEADWWRYDRLPEVPPPETLSGQLIAHFVAEQQNKNQ
ncbi:NAD(+) diphosphatase [Marinimicrobium sp. ABcell2]|uniref:NAD(+) diphosphatase n=1 Tax=Marinimicrobium sp. ABcell2 TaxID=3069751 RepID=UPI0027B29749|nr:NAD(+) diphosphatase [Marinimicrobium sp. ABcell2]MDQ2075709.1 NAD(+) diphosphatase [Marinimicrobium sp. ABcell2]